MRITESIGSFALGNVMVTIVYAHDGVNEYDRFFLNFLTKENLVYLLTFHRKPCFFSSKTRVVRMPRVVCPPTDKVEGLYMYIFFPLRVIFLRLFFKLLKPDIVLGCMATKYGFYAALTGFKPLILIVWGSDVLIAPKRLFFFRFMAQFALRKADAVIVDSTVQENAVIHLGCTREKILKFPWFDLKNIHVTYSRAEMRKKLGWHNNTIVISLRKHEPIYCVGCLIDAIPYILSEVPKSRFLILGKGQLTEKFKRKVKEMGLEQYVRFIGHVSRKSVASYLNAADVYVSTSLSDGTSASLLEAMALGIPPIVTDIEGNREWIVNNWNGFLVPPNDPRSLAEKAVYLIESTDFRLYIGKNGLITVKTKVDWPKNSEAFADLILELCRDRMF